MSERCAYCGSEEPDNGPRKFVCMNDRDEFGFICWDCAQKSVRREQMEADANQVQECADLMLLNIGCDCADTVQELANTMRRAANDS